MSKLFTELEDYHDKMKSLHESMANLLIDLKQIISQHAAEPSARDVPNLGPKTAEDWMPLVSEWARERDKKGLKITAFEFIQHVQSQEGLLNDADWEVQAKNIRFKNSISKAFQHLSAAHDDRAILTRLAHTQSYVLREKHRPPNAYSQALF